MVALGIAGRRMVGVTDGGPEKMTYMVLSSLPVPPTAADVDPNTGLVSALPMKSFLFMPTPGPVKTGTGTTASGRTFDTATMAVPANAVAIDHGHRDLNSEAFVDAPTPGQNPYGDTWSLSRPNPIPTATVSNGQVGWHVLDGGRLKFIYPTGSMSQEQIDMMQQNLNYEQGKFLRPK